MLKAKAGQVMRVKHRKGVLYQFEFVSCGKRDCASCPHGPYWYAYWRSNGKMRSEYIGRALHWVQRPRHGRRSRRSRRRSGPAPVRSGKNGG